MTDEISLRVYENGDEIKLVNLLTTTFGEWPDRDLSGSTIDFWRWKYDSSIHGPNLIAVASIEDSIIGCNHGYLFNVKVGDRVYLCGSASDLAVHPDHRQKGVSKLLSQMKTKLEENAKIDFAYWVTENPIIIKNNREKKTNPVFPYKIVEFTRIVDVKKHIDKTETENALIKQAGYTVIKQIKNIRQSLFKPQIVYDKDLQVENVEKFDEKIDDLWELEKGKYKFIIERRRDYLNWRYCDPRAGDYIKKVALIEDKIIGYIVYRVNKFRVDYPTGFIIDLFAPSSLEVGEALLQESLKYFDSNDVNVVRYWTVEGSPILDVMRKHGFMDLGRQAPEIILSSKRIVEDWKKFYEAEKGELFFQLGDTEFI